MAVKEDGERTLILSKCWLPEMNTDEDRGYGSPRNQGRFVLVIISDIVCDGTTVRVQADGLRGGALQAILQCYQMNVPTDVGDSRMSRDGTSPKEKELTNERTLCNGYLSGSRDGACLVWNL
jgi:hypothetical protein